MPRYFVKKILLVVCAVVLVSSPIAITPVEPVLAASLQSQLDQLEKELAIIKKERQTLQTQVNAGKNKIGSYSGKIGQLRAEVESQQLDIAELELEIEELELSIEILQKDVDDKQLQIDKSSSQVGSLEKESEVRISNSYMDYRARKRNRVEMFSAADVNSYFKDSQYRQELQAITSKSVVKLLEMREQLSKDQALLEEKTAQMKREKEVMDEQKGQVERKQANLKAEIDRYYGAIYAVKGSIAGVQDELEQVSQEEAKAQAQAEKIRQQIFNSFSSISSGKYVVKGTMIGRQGKTGKATGPHLHFSVNYNGASKNPCSYLSGLFCGGNGKLAWPLKGTFYYTSKYGNRCISGWGCSFHAAIDIANSIWNAPVYAAHDGYLQKGVDQYGALYIVICQNKGNCNSGFKTGYWHLSQY